jgi:heme A synthase
MDAGLVVVLAVTGVVLLVPLVFAWVSTNPRRWARVERVLGREPKGSERWVRWAPWFWVVGGAAYVAMGTLQVRSDQPNLGWLALMLGVLYLATGAAGFLVRGRVRRERSSQTQVQDRAEPGRPGAGG